MIIALGNHNQCRRCCLCRELDFLWFESLVSYLCLRPAFGRNSQTAAKIPDATNPWRKLPFILLIASLLVFGCFPRLLTSKIEPGAQQVVDMATSGQKIVRSNFVITLQK